MNKLFKIFLLLFIIDISGCSKANDINNLINNYKSSSNVQYGYEALELIKNILNKDGFLNREWLFDDEIKSLIDMSDIALSKENYKLFVDIYEILELPINNKNMQLISNNYNGKNAHINDLIARWHIEKGRVKSAFKRLEIAALDDRSKADAVKYMLIKYGCMDTASIWSELSSSDYDFMNSYDVGGDKYPAIPTSLNYEDIVRLRIALRNGSLPSLQLDCPIHKLT